MRQVSLAITQLKVSGCDAPADGTVVIDSIRRFKGLESPVVIVAATTDAVREQELPYVALSRARTHLVLVGAGEVLRRLRFNPPQISPTIGHYLLTKTAAALYSEKLFHAF